MNLPPNPAAVIQDAPVREAFRRLFAAETGAIGEVFKLVPFRDARGLDLVLLRANNSGAWQTVAAWDRTGQMWLKGDVHAAYDFTAAGWNP